MTSYFAQRLLATLAVVPLVVSITFLLRVLVPGDPVSVMLGQNATPESIALLRSELGLDQPIPVQYLKELERLARGDLGQSIRSQRPVVDLIVERFPVTFDLTLAALLIAIVVGLPAALVSATRPNSFVDSLVTGIATAGIAMPSFWLGILLILLFSLILRWIPPSGYIPLAEDPVGNLRMTILPALTLGAPMAAIVARQARSSLLEVLSEPFVTTAHAKGLAHPTVVRRHVLKIALIPVISILGVQISRLLGGAVIVEMIFVWPGMGRLIVDAIVGRDYPVVQGAALVMAVIVLLSSLIVDYVYLLLDPRIRYA